MVVWNRKENGEKGMIVVETTISFTIFITMIFSIIYITNMLILHDRVQTALNSAAHELSSYTYLYAAFGGRDAERTIQKDGAENTGKIDDVSSSAYSSYQKVIKAKGSVEAAAGEAVGLLNELQDFGGNVSAAGEDGVDMNVLEQQFQNVRQRGESAAAAAGGAAGDVTDAAGQVKDTAGKVRALVQNKESLISGLAYMGLEAAEYGTKNLLGTGAAYLMTSGYLKQGNQSADEFLKNYGVREGYAGIDFSGSTLFCDKDFRMIDLVAEYDVEVDFIRLLIPNFKMHMVNRVSLPAWLDGDGVNAEPGA